jgi:hypothetical protein
MKLLLVTIMSAVVLTSVASAQTQEGGSGPLTRERLGAGPATAGAGRPEIPSGQPSVGAPNQPRDYGETNTGRRVNPDRVPALSPGGQGEPNR